ncbi:MAG: hypothetical protein JO359_01030 [Candidatus Eremiobacteraeota bacterium]|nr:hypothetical protein [Candidatus Eremiobacteraeota bacterium]
MHDIRNHLAVAVANIEAIADGKLEATPKRLEAILQSLRTIDALVGGLKALQADGVEPENGG